MSQINVTLAYSSLPAAEVAEVLLSLSPDLWSALEAASIREKLTVGQFARRTVTDFLLEEREAISVGDARRITEQGGGTMLVLSRKCREAVVVGPSVETNPLLTVTVLDIVGGRVKLGFEVGQDMLVHRWEIWEQIRMNEALRSELSNDHEEA